jgi:O-antigen/teichoic acid export membrane protein
MLARARTSGYARAVLGTAITNSLSLAAGVLGGALLARELGPTLRGDLAVVTAWPTFAGLAASLGLPQASCYWISRRSQEAPAVLSAVTLASMAISVSLAVVGVALAPLIARNEQVTTSLRWVFMLLPLLSVPTTWIGSLQAARTALWNVARLIQPVAYCAGVVWLAVMEALTLQNAVRALTISLIVHALASGTLVLQTFGLPRRAAPTLWRPLLSYASRVLFSGAPLLVNSRVDQLVLSLTVPAGALGNYTVAVSLSLVASPVSFAFGYVAFPRVASSSSTEDRRRVGRTSILGALGTASLILLPMSLVSPWLVPTVFGSGYESAVTTLWVLVPAAVVFIVNQVMEEILRGRGLPSVPAIAEGAGALVTIVLLLLLVPKFGIIGAAIASGIAYSVVAGLLLKRIRDEGIL